MSNNLKMPDLWHLLCIFVKSKMNRYMQKKLGCFMLNYVDRDKSQSIPEQSFFKNIVPQMSAKLTVAVIAGYFCSENFDLIVEILILRLAY